LFPILLSLDNHSTLLIRLILPFSRLSMATKHLRPTDCLAPLDAPSVCIWLNGSPQSERPQWKQLWNSAELRACTDGGANLIVHRVKSSDLLPPTLISGDMDSISPETSKYFQSIECEMLPTPDQDKTDLTKCLELVAERVAVLPSPPAHILILGGVSGRFDHSLATINSLLNSKEIFEKSLISLPLYLIDGENLTFVVGEGAHSISLSLPLLTGICGVVPFCQRETRVSTTGLRWNLEDTPMEFGGIVSTSNEIVNGRVEIITSAPLIITCEVRSIVTTPTTSN
ncbi:hypothetical protein PFISCL1PPCAC_9821, partial [Pristionchus fissidentatus]